MFCQQKMIILNGCGINMVLEGIFLGQIELLISFVQLEKFKLNKKKKKGEMRLLETSRDSQHSSMC